MRKLFFLSIFFISIIINVSCKCVPIFQKNEIIEFKSLGTVLRKMDFSCGSKWKHSAKLRLLKVLNNPFKIEESYFSIEEYPTIKEKFNSVAKEEKEVFFILKEAPSGWCKAIVYMFDSDKALCDRAEVFVKIDENLSQLSNKLPASF